MYAAYPAYAAACMQASPTCLNKWSLGSFRLAPLLNFPGSPLCMPAGFTDMSKQVEPKQVMTFLNKLFTVLDKMVDTFGVQKVETAGDCYIAACGILSREEGGGFSVVGEQHDAEDSACRVMAFAKAILEASKQVCNAALKLSFSCPSSSRLSSGQEAPPMHSLHLLRVAPSAPALFPPLRTAPV